MLKMCRSHSVVFWQLTTKLATREGRGEGEKEERQGGDEARSG